MTLVYAYFPFFSRMLGLFILIQDSFEIQAVWERKPIRRFLEKDRVLVEWPQGSGNLCQVARSVIFVSLTFARLLCHMSDMKEFSTGYCA